MRVHVSAGVAPVEDLQTPRHRGLATVEFLVEVISQPANRLGENDTGGDRVAERGKRNAATATGDPRTHTAQGDRTPDSQAAVPDTQCRAESRAAFTEISPPVGCQVVQPAPDKPERHGPQGDVINHTALATTSLPASITDQQCS